MSGDREVVCRPLQPRVLWSVVALGPAGAALAAVRLAHGSGPQDKLFLLGVAAAVVGIVCLHPAGARVSADAYGLHSRTVLRRRHVPWQDIAELRVSQQEGRNYRMRRLNVVPHHGRRRRLPLPVGGGGPRYEAEFDEKLAAMRALHRDHGTPAPGGLPGISRRGAARPLALCALLLVAAGVSASFAPVVGSTNRAWKAAVPCTARTPAAERGECLSSIPAVIERTKVGGAKQRSWLYFVDDKPLNRLSVSHDGARGFHPGDRVELTVWRHEVRTVTGAHHVWRDHFVGSQTPAVLAALFVLAAGIPGAEALRRRRGRGVPVGTSLPPTAPFLGAIAGTALWLLPLCFLHPTDPFGSAATIIWSVAGVLATLAMCAWAWRATAVRPPSAEERHAERLYAP
jgi:hypothetical protein